jgi:hypothetical protein
MRICMEEACLKKLDEEALNTNRDEAVDNIRW